MSSFSILCLGVGIVAYIVDRRLERPEGERGWLGIARIVTGMFIAASFSLLFFDPVKDLEFIVGLIVLIATLRICSMLFYPTKRQRP